MRSDLFATVPDMSKRESDSAPVSAKRRTIEDTPTESKTPLTIRIVPTVDNPFDVTVPLGSCVAELKYELFNKHITLTPSEQLLIYDNRLLNDKTAPLSPEMKMFWLVQRGGEAKTCSESATTPVFVRVDNDFYRVLSNLQIDTPMTLAAALCPVLPPLRPGHEWLFVLSAHNYSPSDYQTTLSQLGLTRYRLEQCPRPTDQEKHHDTDVLLRFADAARRSHWVQYAFSQAEKSGGRLEWMDLVEALVERQTIDVFGLSSDVTSALNRMRFEPNSRPELRQLAHWFRHNRATSVPFALGDKMPDPLVLGEEDGEHGSPRVFSAGQLSSFLDARPTMIVASSRT